MKCRNCGTENSDNARFCANCGGQTFETNTKRNKSGLSPLKIFALVVVVLILAISGIFAYVVYFDTSNVELLQLTSSNSGNVLSNSEIANNIPNTEISELITNATNNGVPIYKIGTGEGPVSVISSGVHGDQLVPTIAAMRLINYLDGRKIKGTVYVIPFTSPEAISQNSKLTNGVNLNKAANTEGTASNALVNFAINNNASAVGDFHETEIGKNPGQTTIMCTKIPNYASFQLASDMSSLSWDKTLTYLVAGIEYEGAVEDELNLKGTTAVTPLVQVPSHGKVYDNAVEDSYDQMLALLYVNGNLDPNDAYLHLANADIDGF
ncbi:MAG TPA: zinc-ribbon domain-containing protein [Methanosphaera sp.]|nr:zinc-ribbon domain-containing protein [Methanosphaera sp.]